MDINSEIQFQQRVWKAQRIGWIIISAFVGAALAGVFGQGPLSRAVAGDRNLRLEYERFPRLEQMTRLRFEVAEAPSSELWLDRRYLESFRVEQITPEPREVESSGEWLVYRFSGSAPLMVSLDLMPETFGSAAGRVRAPAGAAVDFRQYIYP